MNIVYENNKVKLVNHGERPSYDLTDIKIYIPDMYRKYQIYLCVRNIKNDIFDSLQLHKIETYSESLDTYVIELKQSYGKLYDGDIICKLFFVNPVKEKMFFSEEFKLFNISFANFKMSSNLFSSSDIEERLKKIDIRIINIENKIKEGEYSNAINDKN